MKVTLQKKVDESKRFLELRLNAPAGQDRLQIANSGGKDSTVLYALIKEVTDTPPPIVYANTTIDPPGTIAFIKQNMPETQILHPYESFYDLVRHKGLPTRLTRYCCKILKEHHSIGKISIEGVRSCESYRRSKYDREQCDTRPYQKGAIHVYPILGWTDEDVWDFIDSRGLNVAPCYAQGMKRLGCIGCPLASRLNRHSEFRLYPRVYNALKDAIKIGMSKHPNWKLSEISDSNPDVAMRWWLSGETMELYAQALKTDSYECI